jgi:hypothetical protein
MHVEVKLPLTGAVNCVAGRIVSPGFKPGTAPYKRVQHGTPATRQSQLRLQRGLGGPPPDSHVNHACSIYLVLPAQGLSELRLRLAPAQGLASSLAARLRFPAHGLPAQSLSALLARFLAAQGLPAAHGADAALAGVSAAIATVAIGTVSKAIANGRYQ